MYRADTRTVEEDPHVSRYGRGELPYGTVREHDPATLYRLAEFCGPLN